MSARWTLAQIEAMLELDGSSTQRLVSQEELVEMERQEIPAVQVQCVCRNNHEPVDGFIFTSPSCQQHGIRSKFLTQSRLTQYDERTVGVVHNTRGGN